MVVSMEGYNGGFEKDQRLEEQFSKLYADFHPPLPPPPPLSSSSSSSSSRARQLQSTPMMNQDVLRHPPAIRRLTLEDAVEEQQHQLLQRSFESLGGGGSSTHQSRTPCSGSRGGRNVNVAHAAVTPPSPHIISSRGDGTAGTPTSSSLLSPPSLTRTLINNVSFQGNEYGKSSSGSQNGNTNNESLLSISSENTWMLPQPVRRSKSLDFLFSGGPSVSRQKKKDRQRLQQQQLRLQQQQEQEHQPGGGRRYDNQQRYYPYRHNGHHQQHYHSLSSSSPLSSSSYRDVNASYMTT
jgi:hypothetical protein